MFDALMKVLIPFDVKKYHVRLPDLPDKTAVENRKDGSEETYVKKRVKRHGAVVSYDASNNTTEWGDVDANSTYTLTCDEVRYLKVYFKEKGKVFDAEKAERIKPHIDKSRSEIVEMFRLAEITGFSDGTVGPYLAALRKAAVQNCAKNT